MADYTQEPWSVKPDEDDPYGDIVIVGDGGRRRIAKLWLDDAPVEDFNAEQRENARRIVAAVNACQGISTKALEAMPRPFSALLTQEYQEATQQRDQLFLALCAARDEMRCANYNSAAERIADAIASIEGKNHANPT